MSFGFVSSHGPGTIIVHRPDKSARRGVQLHRGPVAPSGGHCCQLWERCMSFGIMGKQTKVMI